MRERAAELDAAAQPELVGQPLERRALRAVADHDPAQVGVRVAQQPQRAQDVGVALARDEVRDGDEVGRGRAERGARREVGAEVHDARAARAERRARSAMPAELASTSRARAERPPDRPLAAGPARRRPAGRRRGPRRRTATPGRARRTASPAGAA